MENRDKSTLGLPKLLYNYLRDKLSDTLEEKDEALNYCLCFFGILEKDKYSFKCEMKDLRLLVLEKE